MLASEKGFQRLSEGMAHLEQLESSAKTEGFDLSAWEAKCYQAMNDDFNSPLLIAQLFDAVKFINAVHHKKAQISKEDLNALRQKMIAFTQDVLGLEIGAAESDEKVSNALEGTVNMLIEIRKQARDNKDFATSDRIRDELIALGVQLKDGKEGTTFSL